MRGVGKVIGVDLSFRRPRQRQSKRLTDLHFNPPLDRVGMLQWNRFDQIVAQGREHALQVMDGLGEDALRPYQAVEAA